MTPKGVAELKIRMPYADYSDFEKDPDLQKVLDVITVDTLVRYVMAKVGA